jgi:hypothetical protein
MDRSPVHYSLFREMSKFMHASTASAVSRVVAAIVGVGVARTWKLGQWLAKTFGIEFKSGVQAVARVLGSVKLDHWKLGAWLLGRASKPEALVPFPIDWTEWHEEKRVLVGAVVVGKRAIPVAATTFHRSQIPRSQNSRENTFLRMIRQMAIEAGRRVVILTDRGFRRVSWVQQLQKLRLDFAVRLMTDVLVHHKPGQPPTLLADFVLKPGQMVDLGEVELREDRAVRVRVIGVRARGQHEPWWIATSLDLPVSRVAGFYDRRMAVEEQFRDTKGCRFGVEMYWTASDRPERIDRMFLLVGVAVMVWTAIGAEAAAQDPTARFPHKTKGPRRSFVTIGRQLAAVLTRFVVTLEWLERWLPPAEFRDFRFGLKLVEPVPAVASATGARK